MTAYIGRRLLHAIPLTLGILTLVFVLVQLAPGDPAALYIQPNVAPEVIEQMRENWGLDQPIHIQYFQWMKSFVTGDFGYSLAQHRPVTAILADRIPNTLILSGTALLIIFALGIALGIIQAVRQHSALDNVLTFGSLFIYSMPSFWLALMLILIFSSKLHTVGWWPDWLTFPPSGITSSVGYESLGFWGKLADRLHHLVLPSIALGVSSAAAVARYMRSSMLEVIRQDYIRTARAKGLPERAVILKHALKNALLPIITLFGLYLPFLLSGAVLVETVFAWPGMGKTIVDAIYARDYPVVMATSFLFAVMVVVGNLIADVLYAVIDPRIRYD
ncbi:MAG: ABC transporter permease [Gemmatimonadetes bacterium]|uniref:ABC transporter permease n=1 Tax=Candidatus Kutchimonas denitrificans TaxID=3056748 RepID=A0AAE4Z7M7_9BACT|nr:ABC transporter permease [Gemmatimonadota bacterium]NIR75305.1 ABC transporter permease [Candidatus Kutchimonas denitrificans]NIS02131.1 ABC transporter permease [Gemmatimonadota bacterium]NIT67956.1 ABC transporter permease [Gemmatimonadota bacterium]NIU53950.1 ABC transporter permease subunit [Gemmatimonadota bacterium]